MKQPAGWAALIAVLAAGPCSAQDTLVSKDEIVRTIADSGRRYELVSGRTEASWNGRELFATVHRSDGDTGASIAAIYERVGDRFRLRKRLRSASSSLLEPRFIWARVEGSRTREQLIAITELFPGTANQRMEHIYRVKSDGTLEDVRFVPAPKALAAQLAPGEAVWKDEENTFSDSALEFTFFIWKRGDRNCCPTGGKIVGTYGLEQHDGGYRIIAKRSKRLPVDSNAK